MSNIESQISELLEQIGEPDLINKVAIEYANK